MPDIAYLNGQFLPLDRAVVPINDRGFVFADGVYEALITYDREPFAIDLHWQRLERSLHELKIPVPIDYEVFCAIIEDGISRSEYDEVLIYVQITRGVSPRAHLIPQGLQPTFLVTFREFHSHAPECYSQGVATVTLPDLRWGRCDIKTIGLLANTMAKTQAREMGGYEAILIGQDGIVHEGSSSNVAIVRDGVFVTHPTTHQILAGVTRSIVLELVRELGIRIYEEPFSVETMLDADEVMLLGTTFEVMPVTLIDGKSIANGHPGPITHQLHELYKSRASAPTAK